MAITLSDYLLAPAVADRKQVHPERPVELSLSIVILDGVPFVHNPRWEFS